MDSAHSKFQISSIHSLLFDIQTINNFKSKIANEARYGSWSEMTTYLDSGLQQYSNLISLPYFSENCNYVLLVITLSGGYRVRNRVAI